MAVQIESKRLPIRKRTRGANEDGSSKRRRSDDASNSTESGSESIYATPATHFNGTGSGSVYQTPATHFAKRSRVIATPAPAQSPQTPGMNRPPTGRQHIRFSSAGPEPQRAPDDQTLRTARPRRSALTPTDPNHIPPSSPPASSDEIEDDDEAPETLITATAIKLTRTSTTNAAKAATAASAAQKAKRKSRNDAFASRAEKARLAEMDRLETLAAQRQREEYMDEEMIKAINGEGDLVGLARADDVEEWSSVVDERREMRARVRAYGRERGQVVELDEMEAESTLLPQELLDRAPAVRPLTPEPVLHVQRKRNKLATLQRRDVKDVVRGPVKVRVLEDINPRLAPRADARAKKDKKVRQQWMSGRAGSSGKMKGIVGSGRMERSAASKGFVRR